MNPIDEYKAALAYSSSLVQQSNTPAYAAAQDRLKAAAQQLAAYRAAQAAQAAKKK